MRFMPLLRADEAVFGQALPAVHEATGEFAREGFTNGTLVEQCGLGPSALGAIVSLADGTITAVDGPFTETRNSSAGTRSSRCTPGRRRSNWAAGSSRSTRTTGRDGRAAANSGNC